jgi:hypothetical protein
MASETCVALITGCGKPVGIGFPRFLTARHRGHRCHRSSDPSFMLISQEDR